MLSKAKLNNSTILSPCPAAASKVVMVKMHNTILSPPYQIKCPADDVMAAVGSSAQRLASSCSTVSSNLNGALRFLCTCVQLTQVSENQRGDEHNLLQRFQFIPPDEYIMCPFPLVL